MNRLINLLAVFFLMTFLTIFRFSLLYPGMNRLSIEISILLFPPKNQQNLTKFKSEIENVNWAELPGYNDPSRAYGNFLKKYTAIYDRCFPLKKVKAKGYTLYKPWLTKALLKSIKKKNVLYKRFLKDGAYYCYCAYVLRISRYSDFLSPMLTNTGIFLRGSKLYGESRS